MPWLLLMAFVAPSSTMIRAAEVVRVGSGSYTTVAPAGVKRPPATIYRTAAAQGPMPTNDWWSSLAWEPLSSAMFPHPLGVRAVRGGMQIDYPGANLTANAAGIIGGGGGGDLVIGHSAVESFSEKRVDAFSDWFVAAQFQSGTKQLRASFGHGSPFVYVTLAEGEPTIAFKEAPRVWSGAAGDAVLGVSVGSVSTPGQRHYGLFAPSGSSWSGLETSKWTARTQGKPYFAVAILPDDEPATLALFRRYAYAHVTDTRVSWAYDQRHANVQTTFAYATQPYEGTESGTLFALYPHQWMNVRTKLLDKSYGCVRGPMKLGEGTSFKLEMTYPGVLPALPVVGAAGGAGGASSAAGSASASSLRKLLDADVRPDTPRTGDTYWLGKQLGKWATLIPIAEQLGDRPAVETLTRRTRESLENFFSATTASGTPKKKDYGLFFYDANWGTLIGYPASFGSDDQLNDHHFHYGYFIRAAGELARRDPAWAADDRWGGMVKLLIRDVASSDRADKLFPFLRNFDPYAGHTWASGHSKFGDGNNNESSSEAINAWYGLILFAEATGDAALRDLGVWLLTTEIEAINHYWFDVTDQFHPRDYTPSVVTMVWGGKGANATWFSGNPEMIHGINWLPLTGGSLYLGRYPEYCEKNYRALVAEKKAQDARKTAKPAQSSNNADGTHWDVWSDLIWMYRGLSDPRDALAQFAARPEGFKPEEGNSLTNTLAWLTALDTYGRIDRTVTADTTFFAVFTKEGQKTHVAWNLGERPRTVTFSDGTVIECRPHGVSVK